MKSHDIENIAAIISYIEAHLQEKLDLDRIAASIRPAFIAIKRRNLFPKLMRYRLLKNIPRRKISVTLLHYNGWQIKRQGGL